MYIEKSLEYTVKGIEILRNETIQLFQNRNNYLSFGTGAIALLFYSAATSQYDYPFLTYIVLLLAIPLLSCFLIIISLYINVQIFNLCRYLRSREMILTYLLESIYENERQRIFNFKNNKNCIQEKIRELFFENNNDGNDLPKDKQEMILRNQIPIYWEGYMLNPIPDKLKAIDLQSYMITWMFSIIALISYYTALIFRVSVKNRCQVPSSLCTNKCSDVSCYNDINFLKQYFDFFEQYSFLKDLSYVHVLIAFAFVLILAYLTFFLLRLKVFDEQFSISPIARVLSMTAIIILLVIFILVAFKNPDPLFTFIFIALIISFCNIFGENIIFTVRGTEGKKVTRKELTEHKPIPIMKDYYSLFLNLTSFLLVMYFLQFHTELSVFILILSTFSYSIFWQIPQFRKTAHRPLNKDIFTEENYYD